MKQKRIEDGYYPCQKTKKSKVEITGIRITEGEQVNPQIHPLMELSNEIFPTTQSAEWFDAVTDPPIWYNPVAIKLVSGEVLECWARVTYDGEKEYYTRLDTDRLIDAKKVVQWCRRDPKIMTEIMKKIKS